MTWSTCWPHPAHVVFPHFLHVTALHIAFPFVEAYGEIIPPGVFFQTREDYDDDVLTVHVQPGGRILRVVAGAALIAVAILLQPTMGMVLAIVIGVVGAAVLLAGAFDVCLIAPLLRLPFTGSAIRAKAASPRP